MSQEEDYIDKELEVCCQKVPRDVQDYSTVNKREMVDVRNDPWQKRGGLKMHFEKRRFPKRS